MAVSGLVGESLRVNKEEECLSAHLWIFPQHVAKPDRNSWSFLKLCKFECLFFVSGGESWLCHSYHGNLLDDRSTAASSDQFASGCTVPSSRHYGHGQSVHCLHERDQYDVHRWPYGCAYYRILQLAQTNRPSSPHDRRCQSQMVITTMMMR